MSLSLRERPLLDFYMKDFEVLFDDDLICIIFDTVVVAQSWSRNFTACRNHIKDEIGEAAPGKVNTKMATFRHDRGHCESSAHITLIVLTKMKVPPHSNSSL